MRMDIITVYTGRYNYPDSNKMCEFYVYFIWYKNDVGAYKELWTTV